MGATVFWQDGNELATISVTFTGTPTSVILTVTDPTGATTTPAMTGSGAGPYTANVASTVAGTWSYLVEGTGTASDAVAGTWTVSSPALTQLYVTPEQLKSRLGITDTADDFEVLLAVQGATAAVEEITGRYFWRGTDTRTYVPSSIYDQDMDDIATTAGLTVKADRDGDGVYEETWTLGTDYQLQVALGQYNPAAKGEQWPYTRFNIIGPKFIPVVWPWSHLDRIQVQGVFGWPAQPRNVGTASLIAAAQIFKLKDAVFGIAGFGEFGVVRIQSNPQIMWLLKRYISGRRVGV